MCFILAAVTANMKYKIKSNPKVQGQLPYHHAHSCLQHFKHSQEQQDRKHATLRGELTVWASLESLT